ATLTPDRIAATAVSIADAEGLDAVTMRRLAADLGVAPMAAYRYVSGKDELLELMVDHVYGEIPPPEEPHEGWRAGIRLLALRARDVLLRHPWAVRTATVILTPNQLAVVENALAALDRLDADAMMTVWRTVDAYTRGAVGQEIALGELMREQGWATPHEARDGLAPRMAWLLDTGRYPTYARYIREATRKDDLAGQFETGLDAVLDGIAARLGI
ncbi:TetR/AcrR family transcriptional regulator, partial [Streptomyces sp. 8K308]|uniref:TetR/AcrR family transcriptional regulator n=1 Tax=Streptomyces sp. 8K308 TaxID=2530388 RepID=UPI001044D4CE